MRSEELLTFQKDISELNNRYSYFLFISEQFLSDSKLKLKGFTTGNLLSLSTEDIFSDNKYSSQFKIPVSKLEEETVLTKEFILRSLFLLSYFQFEIYLKDIYNFVKSYKSELPEIQSKKSMITQIENNFDNLFDTLTQKDLDTIEFLRLLRNALVHRASISLAKKELRCLVPECRGLDKS